MAVIVTFSWNRKIISVALLGNFMHETPREAALGAFDILVQHLVQRKIVVSNFSLHAMCDLSYNYTDSPGRNLYNAVNNNAGDYATFGHVVSR